MRSRIFADVTTSRAYENAWITVPAQSSNENYTSMITRTTRRDQMLDVVTPMFNSVRNKGGIICSPMYRETLYHDIDHTCVEQKGHLGTIAITQRFHQDILLGSSVPSIAGQGITALDTLYNEFSREIDLSITRAHAEVDVSEMQLLATLGELPETLDWIQSLITRGVKLTRAFRSKAEAAKVLRNLRNNTDLEKRLIRKYERFAVILAERKKRFLIKKPSSTLVDDFSGLWLEYRYALRPLISDLQNALKALEKVLDGKRYTARGHEYSVGKSERVVKQVYLGTTRDILYKAKIQEDESIKARSGVLYTLSTELLSMFEILGLDQPVESLYELIPFSFILDWFFSIGDMLQSWFKSSGVNILTTWNSLLVKRATNIKITDCIISNKNGYIWDSTPMVKLGSSHLVVEWKWRKPDPPLPLLPSFDLKLNLAKIIDLGMIGRALLGGSVPTVSKRS